MNSSGGSISSLCFAAHEYETHQSDLAADVLMKELNELLDVNVILSCGDDELKRFVSSILKILTLVDSHSQLAWSVLSLLSKICNAAENENIVSHLQMLTPMVSKFMLAAVKEDRKVCALSVLQTLTYGIKIPHPDTFVAPLIASLMDCAKPGNGTSVIQLSLSVLANLLHQNKAVLFTLMQSVNIKTFMKELLAVRMCKMEVCKLMFLLEDLIHEKPGEDEVLNFIRVSFCTVLSSGKSKSTSHLHHCVLFFADMVNNKKITVETLDHPWFYDSIQKVITLLDSGLDKTDLDCAMLLFKFLKVFIKMELPSMSTFHKAIMQQGLAWAVQHKRKASEVITTMQSILSSQIKSQSNQGDGMTGDELISVFVPLLKETSSTSMDHYFLTVLLDFLSTALEVDLYNILLKEYLDLEIIESLIETIPSNININSSFNEIEPVVKMSIYLVNFVSKIVTCCNKSWISFYTSLFRNQKVVTTLAAALFYGSSDLKGKVLALVGSSGFPGESIELLAKSMTECGRMPFTSISRDDSNEFQISVNTGSTCAEVKKLIGNINNLISCNKLQDISTSSIFQLYDYRVQLNSDYQNSLVSSLSRASTERSLLQEQLNLANQITSDFRKELCSLRPAYEEMCNKLNDSSKIMEEYERNLSNLTDKLIEETNSSQLQIKMLKENSERLERELIKATSQIEDLKGQLVEKADSLTSVLKEKAALQEDYGKVNIQVTNLTKELQIIDTELKSKSKQVVQLEQEKKDREREVQELQRIRDTVFELTGGRKKF